MNTQLRRIRNQRKRDEMIRNARIKAALPIRSKDKKKEESAEAKTKRQSRGYSKLFGGQ